MKCKRLTADTVVKKGWPATYREMSGCKSRTLGLKSSRPCQENFSLSSTPALIRCVPQTYLQRTLTPFWPSFSGELTRLHWDLKLLTDVLFFLVVNVIDIEMIND